MFTKYKHVATAKGYKKVTDWAAVFRAVVVVLLLVAVFA